MTLSPRDRRVILLGAAVLAAAAAVRFILVPLASGWAAAREEAAACRSEINGLERKVVELVRLRDGAAAAYGPAAAEPPPPAEAARIASSKAIQDALRSAGVQFESISPQPARPLRDPPDVAWLPFQVKGKCDLPKLSRLLAGLRASPLPMVVERVSVTSQEKNPGQLELTIVLATLGRQERKGP